MSLDTLNRIYHAVLGCQLLDDPIEFVWHAGEPLLASKDFYREAFKMAKVINSQYNRTFSHGIQTNGTLLDPGWVQLFKEYEIAIGVSIDGPEFVHDRYRVTSKEKGTHSKVMKGIRLLQEAELEFSTISVLTSYALNYVDEIFEFFFENGISKIAFNIDETCGNNTESTMSSSEAVYKYKLFMRRLMELVDCHPGKVTVRELVSTTSAITQNINLNYPVSRSTNTPLEILTFDTQGNFSTFCPELSGANSKEYNNFVMGNIWNNKIEEILENLVFKKVNELVQKGVERCKHECDYWHFCGGGCPSNKFFETGSFESTETLHCQIHQKSTVDTVIEYLESKLIDKTAV